MSRCPPAFAVLLACNDGDTGPFADDPRCEPKDDRPSEHAPSEERGMPIVPEGGGAWSPRLAGCTFTVVTAAGESATNEYDDEGRITHGEGIGPSGDSWYGDYTYGEDGCLVWRDFGANGVSVGESTYTCDRHGYRLCGTDGTNLFHWVNTYDGDDLHSVTEKGGGVTTYVWDDGHVVEYRVSDDDIGTGWSMVHSYDGEDLLRTEKLDSQGDITTWWRWTYDDAHRVLTKVSNVGHDLTFTYDGGDWPVSAENSDGTPFATYTVTCAD